MQRCLCAAPKKRRDTQCAGSRSLWFASPSPVSPRRPPRPGHRSLIVVKTGATTPLATGLGDPVFQSSQAAKGYAMAQRPARPTLACSCHWDAIAPPTLPGGFNPTDPTSPYYHWGTLDASVAAANANGVTPILDIISPPDWGYHVQPAGTFKGGQPETHASSAHSRPPSRSTTTVPIPLPTFSRCGTSRTSTGTSIRKTRSITARW